MKQDFLKNEDTSKIHLIYLENGKKIINNVVCRYMDTKECYFAFQTPTDFKKPKKNCQAEVIAYRTDGIYKATVKIREVSFSLQEVMFTIDTPKQWKHIQLRQSSRRKVQLDFNISFDNGKSLKSTTFDMSLGGISFLSEQELPKESILFKGNLVLNMPAHFKKHIIVTEAKFKRVHKISFGNYKYCNVYQFTNLTEEDSEIIKMILVSE